MEYKVYIHTNNSNGKVYVGMTGRDVKVRWGKNGIGYKQHKHFWAAICKYGWDGFTHEIYAEGLTKEEAGRLEQFLIGFFDSTNPDHGYNISIGGEAGFTKYKTKEEREEARRASLTRCKEKQREMRAKLKAEWDAARAHVDFLTMILDRKRAYTSWG